MEGSAIATPRPLLHPSSVNPSLKSRMGAWDQGLQTLTRLLVLRHGRRILQIRLYPSLSECVSLQGGSVGIPGGGGLRGEPLCSYTLGLRPKDPLGVTLHRVHLRERAAAATTPRAGRGDPKGSPKRSPRHKGNPLLPPHRGGCPAGNTSGGPTPDETEKPKSIRRRGKKGQRGRVVRGKPWPCP